MRLGRLILAVCGVAALATASGIFVVALSLALFAAVEPMLGPAGAAAAVALACLLILAVSGLTLLAIALFRPQRPAYSRTGALGHDLPALATKRPIIAILGAAAATAIGIAALRNPQVASGLVSLFLSLRRPR